MRRYGWLLLLVVLVGCGHSGPARGTVTDKGFTPAHDEWVAPIDIQGSCSGTGASFHCDPGIHVPGRFDHYADRWSLYIVNGDKKGWVNVPRSLFDQCAVGKWCDTKPFRPN